MCPGCSACEDVLTEPFRSCTAARTADAWSTAFFVLGCDSAFAVAARLTRWRVSVVCADSGGVRWSPDLEGRVLLPKGSAPYREPAGRGP